MMKLLAPLLIVAVVTANVAVAQPKQLQPVVAPVLIDDVAQAKLATHPVARFLEPSSVVLVDIDVTQLDVQETIDWIETNFAPAAKASLPEQPTAMVSGMVQSLQAAGAAHLYVTGSTRAIIDGGPVIAIPCENVVAVKALAESVVQSLPKQANYIVQVVDGTVLLGPQISVERLLAAGHTARPDLLAPLVNAERADHVAVLSLPQTAREDLAAIWPDRLPSGVELTISPRELAADVRAIIIGWKLPPHPHMKVAIETEPQAVLRVDSVVRQLVEMSPPAKQTMTVSTTAETVSLEATPEKIAALFQTITGPARQQADRQAMIHSLKQIGLAMHNYHEVNKHFPPRVFTDPQGKPLLGWRVAILPFIEQAALAKQIKMDQPWDSPDNAKFGDLVLPTYSTGNEDSQSPAKTRIRVPVMLGSFWHGDGPPRSLRDIKDGTANTIAAIMAPQDAQVTWTSPEPWLISADTTMEDVFGDNNLIITLFFDGSVHLFTTAELDNQKLKALLTFDGGEPINW